MKKYISLTALCYVVAVAGIFAIVNACNKSKPTTETTLITNGTAAKIAATPLRQGEPQTKVVSVLGINTMPDGKTVRVMFRELEEVFTVNDPTVLSGLQTALNGNKTIKITFDPWKATVNQINPISDEERMVHDSRQIISSPGSSQRVDLASMSEDVINNMPAAAILNTVKTGLTDVIPDMATAQLMFDYITHQCCALPGPYGIDQCISFQYCEDGCYARAHKMCFILNNKYHYATHKVFSFAYPDGPNSLCVKGEKWGGCCINWWYHVAPLVNIKTPTGTKAYVFDPAMFDQPVLLATWLHAQQNPACASGAIPKVTSINIQPTASYSPIDTAHFDTDPTYSMTNSTLVSYAPLTTCP